MVNERRRRSNARSRNSTSTLGFPHSRSEAEHTNANACAVTGDDQEAVELTALLWSSDHAQRKAAKRQLVKYGPAAIPPLLSLLQDICTYPQKKRFPTGSETEASRALDHYQDYDPEDLYHLEITSRLRDDAAGLLGDLYAVEAVEVLIEAMHRQVEISFPKGLSIVMRSLAQIGALAVPSLLREIEIAPSKARSFLFCRRWSRRI